MQKLLCHTAHMHTDLALPQMFPSASAAFWRCLHSSWLQDQAGIRKDTGLDSSLAALYRAEYKAVTCALIPSTLLQHGTLPSFRCPPPLMMKPRWREAMPAPAQVLIMQQVRAASQELPTLRLSSSLQCGKILCRAWDLCLPMQPGRCQADCSTRIAVSGICQRTGTLCALSCCAEAEGHVQYLYACSCGHQLQHAQP